jgi:hypothetical protein
MRTVAIEDIMADTIVSFCENAAQLGCPRNKDVDMWFRELSSEERYEVMSKLIEIEWDLIDKEFESNICDGSCDCDGSCGDNCKCNNEIVEADEFKQDKIVEMHEIELDLEKDLIETIIDFARSKIVNDRDELINYGVNYALKEIIKSKEEYPLYDYSIIMEDHSIWKGQAETPLEASLNASEETGKMPMYFMSNERE